MQHRSRQQGARPGASAHSLLLAITASLWLTHPALGEAQYSQAAAALSAANMGIAAGLASGNYPGALGAAAATQFVNNTNAVIQNQALAQHSKDVQAQSTPKQPAMTTFSPPSGPDYSKLQPSAGVNLMSQIQQYTDLINTTKDTTMNAAATGDVQQALDGAQSAVLLSAKAGAAGMPNGQKPTKPAPPSENMMAAVDQAIAQQNGGATSVTSSGTSTPAAVSPTTMANTAGSPGSTSGASTGATTEANGGNAHGGASQALTGSNAMLVSSSATGGSALDGSATLAVTALNSDPTVTDSATGDPTASIGATTTTTTSTNATTTRPSSAATTGTVNLSLERTRAAAVSELSDTVQKAVSRLLQSPK